MIDKLDRIKSSDLLNTNAPVKRAQSSSSASSASFAGSVSAKASASSGGLSAASSVSGLLGAGNVSLMLGVQELGDALSRASRGKERAEDTLKKLDKIRLSLVSGSLHKSELESLSETVSQQKEIIDDPVLSEILDDIDLRARVELAKYI
ncbi:MAG: flagellar assembly protein FliX [Alphaproteobacteria bacterium]|nr:flagellar assembly protein FliX [Alphaproteobacteria bacterium]MCL2505517.1 flagellar assembly protein FliX [Alphaproteobacteria bacterium]